MITWPVSSFHSMTRSPPRRWIVTRRPVLPLKIAATPVAQAPVPQASVSPVPRSQTRICSSVRLSTFTNSAFTRRGKRESFSIFGPSPKTKSSVGSSTKMTQCGFPIETHVTRKSRPSISNGTSTAGAFGSPEAARSTVGTFSGARTGSPMTTRTRTTCPASISRSRVRTPIPVSIRSGFFSQMPRSCTYFATQRTALPHISASLPSALNIRIRASARSDGQMSTSPSPPTPKWRSEIFTASVSGGSGSVSEKRST